MEEIISFIPTALFLGLIYIAAIFFWKKTSINAVRDWCYEQNMTTLDAYPIKFSMGNPAKLSQVVSEKGILLACEFELSSGFGFELWHDIKLISKTPFNAIK